MEYHSLCFSKLLSTPGSPSLQSCMEPPAPASIPAFRRGRVSWRELWPSCLPALAAPHLLAAPASCSSFQSSLLHGSALFWLLALLLQGTGIPRPQFDLLLSSSHPFQLCLGCSFFCLGLCDDFFFFYYYFSAAELLVLQDPFAGLFSSHFVSVMSSSPRRPMRHQCLSQHHTVEQGSPPFPRRQGCCFALALWLFPAVEGRAWEEGNTESFVRCGALRSIPQSWLPEQSVMYPPLQHMLPLRCAGHSPPPAPPCTVYNFPR